MGTIIDWTDPKCMVSTNFSVHDCLFLLKWNRMAAEGDGLTEEVKDNLINLCAKMEMVRSLFNDCPIVPHCTFRPEGYNRQIGGAKNSSHLVGMAMDFHREGFNSIPGCEQAREILIPHLEEFDIYMEDNRSLDTGPGAWLHIQTRPIPSGVRFFKP